MRKKPTAIVGSVVRDFPGSEGGSNFLAGDSGLFVIEACEYRDHVLKLSPEILILTNIELDHTDYFPDLESLQTTFRTAATRVLRRTGLSLRIQTTLILCRSLQMFPRASSITRRNRSRACISSANSTA